MPQGFRARPRPDPSSRCAAPVSAALAAPPRSPDGPAPTGRLVTGMPRGGGDGPGVRLTNPTRSAGVAMVGSVSRPSTADDQRRPLRSAGRDSLDGRYDDECGGARPSSSGIAVG